MSGDHNTEERDLPPERVEEVLERIESGVRQRRAELTTVAHEVDELRLLELRSAEYLEEPPNVSPRPVIGPLLVFARKVVFHLFTKWYLRSMLTQQNRFNQAASALIQDLLETQAALARRLDELSRLTESLAEPGDESSGSPGPE